MSAASMRALYLRAAIFAVVVVLLIACTMVPQPPQTAYAARVVPVLD